MKIFLIGPGGVGKSTCGKILANLFDHVFIDLDKEFCKHFKNINTYIKNYGYKKYCLENSKLFYKIINQPLESFVFSLSSGFLVYEDMNELILKHKQSLKDLGISVLLLPSKSLDKNIKIVIKRQLSRGFNLKKDREKAKFIQRFQIYKNLGDIKIFSHDKPEIIAKQMEKEILFFAKSKK